MVIERVTSAAVRELSARELLAARARVAEHVARTLANEQHNRTNDHVSVVDQYWAYSSVGGLPSMNGVGSIPTQDMILRDYVRLFFEIHRPPYWKQ